MFAFRKWQDNQFNDRIDIDCTCGAGISLFYSCVMNGRAKHKFRCYKCEKVFHLDMEGSTISIEDDGHRNARMKRKADEERATIFKKLNDSPKTKAILDAINEALRKDLMN